MFPSPALPPLWTSVVLKQLAEGPSTAARTVPPARPMALRSWVLTPAEAASPWGARVMLVPQRAEGVPTPTSGALVCKPCWPSALQGAWG